MPMLDIILAAEDLLLSTESVNAPQERGEIETRDWSFDWPII
ncbi:hypothetical protein ACWDRB_65505 [Nonomuraea sp. NPDC003707]